MVSALVGVIFFVAALGLSFYLFSNGGRFKANQIKALDLAKASAFFAIVGLMFVWMSSNEHRLLMLLLYTPNGDLGDDCALGFLSFSYSFGILSLCRRFGWC
jgi:hypothetical protein